MQAATVYLMLAKVVLNLIVAIGQWQIYPRLERVEARIGLLEKPLFQQRPSQDNRQ
jgi:hypothetical protein